MSRGKIITLIIAAGVLLVLIAMIRSCQAADPPPEGQTSHVTLSAPAFEQPA